MFIILIIIGVIISSISSSSSLCTSLICNPCPKGFYLFNDSCKTCSIYYTTDPENDIFDCILNCDSFLECYSENDFAINISTIIPFSPPPTIIEPTPLFTPLGWVMFGLFLGLVVLIIIISIVFCTYREANLKKQRENFRRIGRNEDDDEKISKPLYSVM